MTKEDIAKRLIKSKGKLSYYALAKLTGMPQHQLQNVEGCKSYTIDTLLKYAEAVGIKIEAK